MAEDAARLVEPTTGMATIPQYSLSKILLVWAAAAIPMGILGWVVAPALAQATQTPAIVRLAVLTVGLVWQFNTFLGEELLFRGLLLPRMAGVFGKGDWVMNGLLFGLYHLHQPWGILSSAIDGILFYALPSRYFRCAWFGVITHSGQSLFFAFLILGLVLGWA